MNVRSLIVTALAGSLAACGPSGPPIHVSAPELYGAYLANAIAANREYHGHTLIVDGMSGGIDNEPEGYVLTLVPGVRAHLASDTGGANLFKPVTVRCTSIEFTNTVLDMDGCTIIANQEPREAIGGGDGSLQSDRSTPPAVTSDRLSAAFEAATGHNVAFEADEGSGAFTVKPLELIDLPSVVVLLTERAMKDGCHACLGAIGISYLSEQGGKFTILKNWPRAIEGSGFGNPPSWHITTKFTRYPAIYSETGYMYQGDSGETASLTELQPNGPITSDPLDISGSNEGMLDPGQKPCVYRGKIVDVKNDHSFAIQFTGSITGQDRFLKRSGKFVQSSTSDRGPECDSDDSY